jgi:hypothetical protein
MKTIPLLPVWRVRLSRRAETTKLRAEADRLNTEGNALWAEAVLEAYGNVPIEWKSATHCVVNGVDEYTEETC